MNIKILFKKRNDFRYIDYEIAHANNFDKSRI